MLNHIGKVVVSLLISNWIYAEAILLCPQLQPYCQRLMQVLRLPTHDEWNGIANSPSAVALRGDIESALGNSTFESAFRTVGLLDDSVWAVHGREMESEPRINGFGSPAVDLPYKFDEDMFNDRPRGRSGAAIAFSS